MPVAQSPSQQNYQPIPDVNFGGDSAKHIAAWFMRQLIGINGLTYDQIVSVLTYCAEIKELMQ